MKKILCPTDFSDTAQNAIVYAAKLAQATGSHLILFNVQSIFDLVPQETGHGNTLTGHSVSDTLEEQSQEISSTFKISCYAEVQPSSTTLAKTIAHKAVGYDLIVMGTNGPDDIFQFLTGSNAYKACVESSVPVLLIPENCMYSEIKTLVYAFDYLRERKLPLTQLIPWIKCLKCELSILQVMEEAYSEEAEEDSKELQHISQKLYAEDIKLKFDTIHSYEIAESIHSYVLRTQPDVLALCTIHRNLIERLFHNSLIRNISSVSSYPVFVFHN
jgi:nucleotide-binding universal stress UspA family protein